MNKLVLAIVLLAIVPALRAQQAETADNPPQATPQAAQPPAAKNPDAKDNTPASLRPGHPLDPADVDVLTGKKDREIEAARTASMSAYMGMYGNYGDPYLMQGRFGREFDIPLLPLTRISNPFFFSMMQPRGFRRGGFRGSR